MTRIEVTDHAVLRWLERGQGVDVAAIRRRIVKQVRMAVPYVDEHGAVCLIAGGLRYQLRPGREDSKTAVVTTVMAARCFVRSKRARAVRAARRQGRAGAR